MSELFACSVTKRSITELLMQQVIEHIEMQTINYVVAGNHKTYSLSNGHTNQKENYHGEADTLMIRCLKLGIDTVHTSIVSLYSADTGVFFLLLSHSEKLDCSSLFIPFVKDWVDIKSL